MASWRFSIGNAVARAAAAPAAVSPATEDALVPLSNLGSGYPDEQGALEWRADGAYEIDFDLNLLATESERVDAPTGWLDLLYTLAGTPGLPANPPDWGAYGGRGTALRLFRPVVQEVDVMPGEQVGLEIGIYWPSGASGATGVRVRVVDRSTGKGWDGTYGSWEDGGVLAEQTSANAWLDLAEVVEADPARTERTVYQVVIEPIAASYGATSYVYASASGAAGAPALFPEVDTLALVGHTLPAGAAVSLDPQPSGTSLALVPAQPSCYVVESVPQLAQVWRLSIAMPVGIQPRPVMGEVWIGKARTMLVGSPVLSIGGEDADLGQIMVESAHGRKEVVAREAPPAVKLKLEFKARDDAAFRQVRDEIARLTRFGGEPLLLLPGERFDGEGKVYHGRIEETFSWSVVTPTQTGTVRTFTVPFAESPFAGP
jgi:hypothetical protein